MLAVLGLLVSPIGGLTGYAISEAWQAKEKALEAMGEARAARPDPFTGTDASRMEQKLIARDAEIIRQCEHKIGKVEVELVEVDTQCLSLLEDLSNKLNAKLHFHEAR